MGVHVTLRESLELSIYGPSSQGIPTLVPWMRSKWQGGRLGAQYSATVRNSICAVHWSRSRHRGLKVRGRKDAEKLREIAWEKVMTRPRLILLERGDDKDGQRVTTERPPSFQTPLYTIQTLLRTETVLSVFLIFLHLPSANSFLISWFYAWFLFISRWT